MDSIFGIGFPELMVILILAGMVMGPHRIRQVARTLGRVTAQLQGVSREFARQLNAELDSIEGGDVKGVLSDMKSLQREVASLRKELGQVPRSLVQEGKDAVKEGKAAFEEKSTEAKQSDSQEAPSQEQDTQEEPATEDAGAAPSRLPQLLEVADDPES